MAMAAEWPWPPEIGTMIQRWDVHPMLRFVLAPEAALPVTSTGVVELEAAQRQGPRGGFALRIFSQGSQRVDDLKLLPFDGRLTGTQRLTPDGTQLICDAMVVHFEPQLHWLGVYESIKEQTESFICIDRFALSEANNETCWFYPTHDGQYVAWEQGLQLDLAPGHIPAECTEVLDVPYERRRLAILWSLLGDDASLRCVGLTYGSQRIEWSSICTGVEPLATWSRFTVDNQAEVSLVVHDSLTVFAPCSIKE